MKAAMSPFVLGLMIVMLGASMAVSAEVSGEASVEAAPAGNAAEEEAPGEEPPGGAAAEDDTYDQDAVMEAAVRWFGTGSKALAKVIEKAFAEQGRPTGYIAGEEAAGAFVFGARYGSGILTLKNGSSVEIFWKGPSVGFDFGGNVAKTFILVYNLRDPERLYQRFPGVDGSLYYIAGAGLTYYQSEDVILAPVRLGVGLRAGASVGYMHYTKERSWVPF